MHCSDVKWRVALQHRSCAMGVWVTHAAISMVDGCAGQDQLLGHFYLVRCGCKAGEGQKQQNSLGGGCLHDGVTCYVRGESRHTLRSENNRAWSLMAITHQGRTMRLAASLCGVPDRSGADIATMWCLGAAKQCLKQQTPRKFGSNFVTSRFLPTNGLGGS